MVETLHQIEDGTVDPIPQQLSANNKIAPKIFTSDCKIEWNNDIEHIRNQIRGLSPYPGAYTEFQNKVLKIYACETEYDETEHIGQFLIENHKVMRIAAKDGYIIPTLVQPEGKRKMSIQDFLNGLRNWIN